MSVAAPPVSLQALGGPYTYESDSVRVPMSQTRPCVGRHAHTCVVKLIRARLLAEPDSRARLTRVWAALQRKKQRRAVYS
jgi:hypothetical protein